MGRYSSPTDLASSVRAEVSRRHRQALDRDALIHLFQTLWSVSLRTEEGHPVSVQLVFLDPADPDPAPPARIRADRWSTIPLAHPVPLEVNAIVKLAGATDPRSSSLAVHGTDQDSLVVWGLIDQANRSFDFLNFDSPSGPPYPGLFHARIEAPGHLSAWIAFDKIAELRVTELIKPPIDVFFTDGPILQALALGIAEHVATVQNSVRPETYDDRDEWPQSIARDWKATLCRVLLRARNYRHGGAVLITRDGSEQYLNVKYRTFYPRLKSSLRNHFKTVIEHTYADDEIFGLMDSDADYLPMPLYLDAAVTQDELDDIDSELDGAIWFVSLLTRVDGLVLMSPDLEVIGFGVEITADAAPPNIVRAEDAARTTARLAPIDYNHYGTRHRSMMRYCSAVPGSVGFVISQDGDVRVMTDVDGCLTMWDNIRIQLHGFAKPRRSRGKDTR